MSRLVRLTAEQISDLASLYERIGEMDRAEKPGMLIAQVYGDHMVVGVLNHEQAKNVQAALGHTSGRMTRTAFDRSTAPVGWSGEVVELLSGRPVQ